MNEETKKYILEIEEEIYKRTGISSTRLRF